LEGIDLCGGLLNGEELQLVLDFYVSFILVDTKKEYKQNLSFLFWQK